MKDLKPEDFPLATSIVDEIIDHTSFKEIEEKLTNVIKDFDGLRKRQFLVHLNILFGNVLINELSFRMDDAEKKALEARRVTIKLNHQQNVINYNSLIEEVKNKKIN